MAKGNSSPQRSARGASEDDGDSKCRLDKWLWAARFFKTRALATEAANKGHVKLNDALAKPSRDVKVGDQIAVLIQHSTWTVDVLGLSTVRASAPIAQALYSETPTSKATREAAATARRLAPEPAQAITQGRPTKRDRRDLQKASGKGASKGWGDRWAASVDD
ncbi:MAG: RNA-binding S4 domain-containing protein [Burkholderiaceae bacterium]|jgi:ribosome-associated heat shock protein Hsp15|nr:RNA-binding S4 domain-containing protein [Burkholderiaceae bacterium]